MVGVWALQVRDQRFSIALASLQGRHGHDAADAGDCEAESQDTNESQEPEMLFEESDLEVESEDDAWFDQLVANAVDPAEEAASEGPDLERASASHEVEANATLLDLDVEDSQFPFDAKASEPCDRPVARPLAGDQVVMEIDIDESPIFKTKKELTSVADDPKASVREKEAHMRLLRGKLRELEAAIGHAKLGTHLITVSHYIADFNMCLQYIYI